MKNGVSYDDVLLVPKYSDIRSRSEVDISTDLGNGLSINLPIISSPMDTISETPMAIAMSSQGGISIIHRYNTVQEQARLVEESTRRDGSLKVGAAVGVTGDYVQRAMTVYRKGRVLYMCRRCSWTPYFNERGFV